MLELSAATRRDHLARMADGELDVLVVGGGITGAGVALDAATRGLTVGLVEREDFAAGTSGRSSRLVHGGLRYLRHGEVGLVRESLRERGVLARLAPHLVRPLPFVIPVYRRSNRAVILSGLVAYDLLGGRRLRPHRWVGPDRVERLAPSLRPGQGGYVYWDCRTDDARLTLEVVRQAAAHGALVANHAEVEGLIGEGRVRGARVVDRVGGERLEVRAGVVVNATGVWADEVQGLAAERAVRLRPSKGVHLVFDRARVSLDAALLVPSVEAEGAFVFIVPWGPRVFAGTTDTPYRGDLAEPPVDPTDVEVVLESVDRAVRADLGRDDVVASWAGVRPLLDTGRGPTRDLSRRHVVFEHPPGLISVTGGKLTTYRTMAEDAVNLASWALGKGGPCRTDAVPLGLTRPLEGELALAEEETRRLGLEEALGQRLVALYGDDWQEAMRLVEDDPSLAEPLVPGLPVRRVEVSLARTRGMALTEEDVLVRRTRLAHMDRRAAASLAGSLPA